MPDPFAGKKTSKPPSEVVAILCADLHLSLRPPVFRSAEPDWLEAQKRILEEIWHLAWPDRSWHIPIIIAGDLFDRPDNPAQLVNFALEYLPPKVYACCGQHDLLRHRYKDIDRTSYGTLVRAGRITNLPPKECVEVLGAVPLRLWGFPWGFKPRPNPGPHDLGLDIAIIHRYVWRDGAGYPGAPAEAKVGELGKSLSGYDLALVGDNHQPFECRVKVQTDSHLSKPKTCFVHNNGSLLRRHSDEINHRPSVGLLKLDGTVERHYLDTSKDLTLEPTEAAKVEGLDLTGFLDELVALGESGLDFVHTVKRYLTDHGIPRGVADVILGSLERGGE